MEGGRFKKVILSARYSYSFISMQNKERPAERYASKWQKLVLIQAGNTGSLRAVMRVLKCGYIIGRTHGCRDTGMENYREQQHESRQRLWECTRG